MVEVCAYTKYSKLIQSQTLEGALEWLALQRRRAHAVAIDDAARVYEAIEELATDIFPSGARRPVVGDDFFFKASAHSGRSA